MLEDRLVWWMARLMFGFYGGLVLVGCGLELGLEDGRWGLATLLLVPGLAAWAIGFHAATNGT